MDSTARLRRELSFEIAKLNGLQKTVDLTVDDPGTKALATEIRKQAGLCLDLLDQYQLSMPGRMRSYSERGCQSLRDDLRRTEMDLRDASGIFQRRIEGRSHRHPITDWSGEFYLRDDVMSDAESDALSELDDPPHASLISLSLGYVDADNRQDLEGLMALIADDVEFKLAFDPALKGKGAVQRRYEEEWVDHKSAFMTITEMFETEGKVALEIHVDSGPPSDVSYSGVVVHQWNDEGLLDRYHLYVDEISSGEDGL